MDLTDLTLDGKLANLKSAKGGDFMRGRKLTVSGFLRSHVTRAAFALMNTNFASQSYIFYGVLVSVT